MTGIFNVVDDEPAPVSEWLPVPRRRDRRQAAATRTRVGRAGSPSASSGSSMMTTSRGASNEKAKRELGWQLRYPSWRLGFKEGLADDVPHEQAVAV